MKKWAAGVLAVLICMGLLSGCDKAGGGKGSAVQEQSEIPIAFDTTALIKYKDIEANATLTRQRPKSFFIEFTSPEGLSGMKFTFQDENVNISYRGLGFDLNPDSMPGEALAKVLVSAIDSAAQKEGVRVSLENGIVSVKGDSESGAFTLTYDKKGGDILTLDVPSAEFSASFQNFNLLQ